jgi:hypothetical protein
MKSPYFSRVLLTIAASTALLFTAPLARAQGSPPLITDDTGTPSKGHWEINVGVSTERRPGERHSEFPLVDLNYGIGERLQIKYEVPFIKVHADGEDEVSGFGNSEVGLKWRFYDAGEKGLSLSIYPQWEFNNPRSSAADRGLAEHGSAIILPIQFEKEVGPLTLVGEIGREFRRDGDSWLYGIAVGHDFTDRLAIGVELVGVADEHLSRSVLIANLGVTVGLTESTSLMVSVGRELHNHAEPRASMIGYIGIQWRR